MTSSKQHRRLSFLEDGADARFEDACVAILPVPYESTVSYGTGTARGPEAILTASSQLELLDEQSGTEPYRCGVWTDRMLILPDSPGQATSIIAERVGRLMDDGKWVAMLGGEHSITPGAVRAVAERRPGLTVVQLDAHADLRESYEGSRWSHACAMARCLELAPVHAFGVRSYSTGEVERMRAGIPDYKIVHGWEMESEDRIHEALAVLAGRPVYLTIDVDFFDPSVVPSTGTPEPGGGRWWPTLRFLEALFRAARVEACDVVELAPIPGLHHAEFTVARLVYKLVGFASREGSPRAVSSGS